MYIHAHAHSNTMLLIVCINVSFSCFELPSMLTRCTLNPSTRLLSKDRHIYNIIACVYTAYTSISLHTNTQEVCVCNHWLTNHNQLSAWYTLWPEWHGQGFCKLWCLLRVYITQKFKAHRQVCCSCYTPFTHLHWVAIIHTCNEKNTCLPFSAQSESVVTSTCDLGDRNTIK